MKTILFCPAPDMPNGLLERRCESFLVSLFQVKVISLTYHQGDSREELFDLVCQSQCVAFSISKHNTITYECKFCLDVAKQLKKPVYRLYVDRVVKHLELEDRKPPP